MTENLACNINKEEDEREQPKIAIDNLNVLIQSSGEENQKLREVEINDEENHDSKKIQKLKDDCSKNKK